MFENGGVTKISDDAIKKLSELFEIDIITTNEDLKVKRVPSLERLKQEEPAPRPNQMSRGFCPNQHCPSNHGYEVEGRYYLRPDRSVCDPVGARYCAVCGEVLEKKCPNCGSPVHDGAICSFCGEPYVVL